MQRRQLVGALLPYGVAVGSTAVALGLTLLCRPVLAATPAVLFYFAVIASTWVGGLPAGLVATLCATLALDYFLLPPLYTFSLLSADNLILGGVFAGVSAVFSLLTAARKQAEAALQRANAALEREVAERRQAEGALRESEQRWRTLAEAMPALVWMARPDGFVDYYNQRWYDYTGLPIEQLAGWGWEAVWHPEDLPGVRARWLDALRTGQPYEYEARLRRADGSFRWHLLRAVPLRDPDGRLLRWFGANVDVEGQKRTEHALRQSEERFRAAQEASLDAFTILRSVRDARGQIVDFVWEYVNPRAAQLLRRPAEALVGRRLLEVLPGNKARSELFADYVRVVETGEPYDRELYYDADGITGWFRNVTVKLGDGVANSFCDITPRKQLEVALQRAHDQLQRHLDNAPFAIVEWDEHFRVRQWSAGAEHIFGWTAAEVVGKHPTEWQFVYEEDVESVEQELRDLRAGRPPGHLLRQRKVNRNYTKAGQVITCEWQNSWLYDAAGNVVSTLSFGQDITARVQEEAERAALLAELRRVNTELQQFAYIVSHDLSEPLRTMSNYVQLLARRYRGRLDPAADEYIAFVTDAARHMQQMLADLLAYTRAGQRPEFTAVDCEAVLARVLDALQVQIAECGAVITHDPLPTVRGDATRLGQVFQNLLSNALKFRGEAPPRIHVAARRADGHWVFAVRDNGIGIDPRHAGRIFELFQRLHPRGRYPGTGMGLAICTRVVERHGGRMWVESAPGQGATFYFTLPGV